MSGYLHEGFNRGIQEKKSVQVR